MSKISVLMPVYNAEQYIVKTIESILHQSFEDIELIIVDDGSTDRSLEMIQTFTDKRIHLFKNTHDYISSCNLLLSKATGTYIARMDADDIMNVDRLKIQHGIMEEDPSITVCGTWMLPFSEDKIQVSPIMSYSGMIKRPLLELLNRNIVFHPTVMVRRSFLQEHKITYQPYPYAEDYKFWTDIAYTGGRFYIEPQPLLYHRINKQHVSSFRHLEEQMATSWKIRQEVFVRLLELYAIHDQNIEHFYQTALNLVEGKLLIPKDIAQTLYSIITNKLSTN